MAVPSRSEQKLRAWRAYLARHVDSAHLERLHTFVGDLSDEADAARGRQYLGDELGTPDGVLAALGRWHSVPSLLSAGPDDLNRVLQGYLIAHQMVARTFLPDLSASGGTYVFVNGPLAFELWGPASALVSIATAAQHMLFRAMAQELDDSPARVAELVTYAFLRNRETQPGSAIPGEAVGAFAAHLLSGDAGEVHGQCLHLRSMEQVQELGLEVPVWNASA